MKNSIGSERSVLVRDASAAFGPAAALSPDSKPMTIFWLGQMISQTLSIMRVPISIGAAALAALALISAYIEAVVFHIPDFSLQINDPIVLAGMFLGGIFPFLVYLSRRRFLSGLRRCPTVIRCW